MSIEGSRDYTPISLRFRKNSGDSSETTKSRCSRSRITTASTRTGLIPEAEKYTTPESRATGIP